MSQSKLATTKLEKKRIPITGIFFNISFEEETNIPICIEVFGFGYSCYLERTWDVYNKDPEICKDNFGHYFKGIQIQIDECLIIIPLNEKTFNFLNQIEHLKSRLFYFEHFFGISIKTLHELNIQYDNIFSGVCYKCEEGEYFEEFMSFVFHNVIFSIPLFFAWTQKIRKIGVIFN